MSVAVRSNHLYETAEASPAHVGELVGKLREEDPETESLIGFDAHEKLAMIFDLSSRYRRSWLVDGRLSAMGGIMDVPKIPDAGHLWLVLARDARQHVSPMFRSVKEELKDIKVGRDLFTTIVRADEDRWRFARHCGFRLQPHRRYKDTVTMEMRRDLPQRPVPRAGAPASPFIVYGLPRSRTAWSANFLTYGGWQCGHDEATFMREPADIGRYFARPRIGTVEPGGAGPAWRLISAYAPNLRMAVIRRPVADVVESTRRLSGSLVSFNLDRLSQVVTYMARMLDQIATIPGTLVLDYDDLDTEAGCSALFEHCLPFEFDRGWWQSVRSTNIQVDMLELALYRNWNRPRIDGFKRACWSDLRRRTEMGRIA